MHIADDFRDALAGLDLGQLDRSESTAYVLRARGLTLAYCNDAWNRFALANDGDDLAHLCTDHVPILDAVDPVGGDVGGYVERARDVVEGHVHLPDGVSLQWSGQYEYLERAQERLALVVPLTLGLITLLLFLHFRRMGPVVMVMVTPLVAIIFYMPVVVTWT